jgi:hypothetical protein
VDIPNEADPDHEQYYRDHETVPALIEDNAEVVLGDEQDLALFRVELENEEKANSRCYGL